MTDIDNLFEEANVSETDFRVNFELHGVTFFYNKDKGIMRKRHKATSLLQFMSDELGMTSGKYDEIIDNFLAGLICQKPEEEPKEIGSDITFDDLCLSLPAEEKGEFVQISMMTTLPYIFALVVLGKDQVSVMMKTLADTLASTKLQES